MGFTQFNVWLDVLFVILWICVIAFLAFHFALFVKTGRFRKAFIEGDWPQHDKRPPATPKVLHAIHMFSMIGLGISGMFVRFPAFDRVIARDIHYVLMIIVTIGFVWRVLYAFMSKKNPRDWKEFAVGREDMDSALGVLAYYGYFSDSKPHVAKYNVLQKLSYNLFLYMMIAQAFTGFALVTTPILFGLSPRDMLVGWWLGALAGSTDLAGWGIRTVHYIFNWLFIIMSTVHLYLAFTVDIPCALDFFGIKPMEVGPHEPGLADEHVGHAHDHVGLGVGELNPETEGAF